ncbi:MAG: YgfZ/GcvT domain-containing protein, partial [Acidimicrobiales bacterium]
MEAVVIERAFVRVKGPDAAAYLQGQLSQDIDPLAVGDGAPAFLLEPNGKVVALLRVFRAADDEFELVTDEPAGEAVAARLRQFLLRTKAEIGDPAPEPSTLIFDETSRDDAMPYVIWPTEPAPQEVRGADVVPDAESGEAVRIAAGIPVSGVDIGPGTIPAEAGTWLVRAAVSFTKGCYTGQELVARIDSRGGNVARRLRGVILGEGAVPVGATLEADGKEAGRITSVAWSPGLGSTVALAYV